MSSPKVSKCEGNANGRVGATFPAQAVLFSRVVEAFQLPSGRAVDQGDFYSLVFFVVALCNLAVYASVGWSSNIVAQVSSLQVGYLEVNQVH